MGQAFDEDGNVLGEAFGHTKQEVFDKLNAEHRDAAELRIRSRFAETKAAEPTNTTPLKPHAGHELPRYLCHKVVQALQIAAVHRMTEYTAKGEPVVTGADLVFVHGDYAPRLVSAAYVLKHQPTAGGYFVVYEDGYESFSPAPAFEAGYTPI